MERTTYFDRYRICVGENDAAREISRDGPSVTYRAVDMRSGETVALQLIPGATLSDVAIEKFLEQTRAAGKLEHLNVVRIFAAGLEGDDIVVASELVSGETADAWVVARGPLPADAIMRIGIQVVDALYTAAFHELTHRALQPSNILILPGQSPDGGWPFIKLLHFGLAGVKAGNEDFPEFVPSLAPQFTSPEQLQNGTVDFRSEIFSLGTTLCFLLTGAVPLAGTATAERRLPLLDKSQKALWPLLLNMLRNDPERRPQDPVALVEEMRVALAKMERRQRGVNPFAVPFATNAPRETATPRSLRRAWALAALSVLLLAALLLAAPFVRRSRKPTDITQIGEPVGVPENTPAPVVAATPEATIVASNNFPAASAAPTLEPIEPASPPPAATIASDVI
ncbi:MAG: serine/threonine protein kinase [Verrucomicrobiota bacterium]|nr:serine/threonine protein kinase [Verrucomicrobiota bacterium]